MIISMVKTFMKFRKKLWTEMLVNIYVNLVVNKDVNGVTISIEPYATGGVHATDT